MGADYFGVYECLIEYPFESHLEEEAEVYKRICLTCSKKHTFT